MFSESVKYLQTRGWRVCTRFHRMCSNKINAICWACKFYGRTGRIERWGNGVCIKEGGRPWTGKWRPVKWTAWKGALLSRLLAFGFLLFNEQLPITIDATTKTGLSSSRRWTLREKRIDAFTTSRIEIYSMADGKHFVDSSWMISTCVNKKNRSLYQFFITFP